MFCVVNFTLLYRKAGLCCETDGELIGAGLFGHESDSAFGGGVKERLETMVEMGIYNKRHVFG